MVGWLKRILQESGLCLDSVRLLDWVMARPAAKVLFFRFLRLRFSPVILEDALCQDTDLDEKGRLFSLGMSFLNVGKTYKTTGEARTGLADREIEKLARDFESPRLLEVGVSDGISSRDNVRSKAIPEVILTDRFNCFYERRFPLWRVFYDSDGRLLGVKFLCFYLRLCAGQAHDVSEAQRIETVNPALSGEFGIDAIEHFDLFCDRMDKPVQIIKCANILNASYFPASSIRQAVNNLSRSLDDGGYLVISHNNERYAEGEALFILKKEGGGFHFEKDVHGHEVAYLFREGGERVGKRRILFLVPSLEVGGAETQLVNMANGLAALSHEVAVAVHYSGGALEGRLKNVRLIRLHKAGRWDFLMFSLRLVRAVHSFAPDAVCSFLGTPNILSSALKPLLRPARIVWSVRSSDMDLSLYGWASRLGAWLEIRFSPFADRIMINSQAGKEYALSQGMDGGRMVVVPNGFDVDRFAPEPVSGRKLRNQWRVPEGALLVGLVARLDPMKDHRTFLEAVQLASQRDDGLRFVCVGEGPQKVELMTYAEELGLDHVLTWAGAHSDMPAVYNALDICCLSSITEGFPNVLGEAMACGVPCVTTDVGDAALLVGETGEVVPPRDPEALSRGLLRLAETLRQENKPEIRNRIVEKYSLPLMIKQVSDLLEEAVPAR